LTKAQPQVDYRLLTEFKRLFEGEKYKHRSSTQGDFVAMHLYEDLVAIGRSAKLIDAVRQRRSVLNVQNTRRVLPPAVETATKKRGSTMQRR
jgi:hypothetical protein